MHAIADITRLPSHRQLAAYALMHREGLGEGFGMTDPYTAATDSILKSLAGIAKVVPDIEAASGLKSAQALKAQQAASQKELLDAQIHVADAQAQVNASNNWTRVLEIAVPVVGVVFLGGLAWALS